MIILILTLAIQIGSHKQLVVEENPLCENKPDIHYPIDDKLFCLPSDLIFKGGFDEN